MESSNFENTNVSDIEKFYDIIKDTEEIIPLKNIEKTVEEFVERSIKKQKRIALVTV